MFNKLYRIINIMAVVILEKRGGEEDPSLDTTCPVVMSALPNENENTSNS